MSGKDSSSDRPPYLVGYKKPPLSGRFKKGQSGNKSGRPKRSRQNIVLVTALQDALNEQVKITNNGRTRRVTKLEAAFKQLANKAAMGDARAITTILRMANELGLSRKTPITIVFEADDEAV